MTDADARALHERAIIIDAHNDTLVERLAVMTSTSRRSTSVTIST